MDFSSALVVCLCMSYVLCQDKEPPVVNTKNGRLGGKLIRLVNDKEVAAYLGIPYAEPPVGELRFKAPVPKVPWNGVFNATAFGPLCAQSKNRSHWDIKTNSEDGKKVLRRLGLWDYKQGEDCLNLNIYVPVEALSESNLGSQNFPVMFYIHGGSYKTNGGQFYPGEWLASAGQVVVVTMNYRLGVLGFLSTADATARGNYGLLDQILALKWIKDNIASFGGEPSDVTIFGNSAGGACVGLHLLSPLSRGLFSKAIVQSGSPIGEWAVQRRPRMYVERLAKNLKCPDLKSSEAILKCLRAIEPERILDQSEDATLEDSLMLQFAPVSDGEFLPKDPNTMLQQEESINTSVPIMVGVTRDELEVWMTKSYQDKDPSSIPFTKDLLRKYLLHLVRKDFMSGIAADVLLHAVYTEYVYRHGTTSNHKKTRIQQQRSSNGTFSYQENSSSVLPDIRTLGKIISDIDLKAPTVKFANLLALHPNVSVYMYEFDYASPDDVIANKFVGSYHESELYYVFGFPHLNLSNALRKSQDKEVSNIMVQLWTDFAKHGNPTPRRRDTNNFVKNFTWRQYTEAEDCFATLGLQPFVAGSYESERMTFWNHFVPLFTEYPISLTSSNNPNSTALSNHTAKIMQEDCSLPYMMLVSGVGWVLATALLLFFLLRTCSCSMFKNFNVIGKLPIPI